MKTYISVHYPGTFCHLIHLVNLWNCSFDFETSQIEFVSCKLFMSY